jgi:hypothetical protein
MKRPTDPPARHATADEQNTLAKLQRLYGRSSLRPDAFGRRAAMPSEIERLIQARHPDKPDPR